MKQDATISDVNDLKEEQAQRRSASSRTRRLAQMNGSHEKTGNMPLQTSNNEEQNRPATSYIKETKENGIEDNARQQNDQPVSEFAGSQIEATEMT